MKKLWERIRKYLTKLKELSLYDREFIKNQNQCRFPGCTDFGTFIYICRYGKPCFCDYHSREKSPWTRSYIDKREWQHKTITRSITSPLL